MEQQHAMSAEVTFHHQHSDEEFKKEFADNYHFIYSYRLRAGNRIDHLYIHKGENPNALLVLMFKGMVCIMTLAKAYYIVSIFMHLGDEIRNMIMTIVVPLMLFIWFITAFIYDGNSYKNLRNKI